MGNLFLLFLLCCGELKLFAGKDLSSKTSLICLVTHHHIHSIGITRAGPASNHISNSYHRSEVPHHWKPQVSGKQGLIGRMHPDDRAFVFWVGKVEGLVPRVDDINQRIHYYPLVGKGIPLFESLALC